MTTFIKYKRISEVLNPNQLANKFDLLIAEGWQIIFYDEKILEKNHIEERIAVSMVVGKPNEGKQ